ncbi:unnamed protein product, partial [Mesorhabditis belari]|uniref:Aminopeptidase n=1 Tax=Mesorhabditis belari TaxID=2138241 RepID=A0AAF3FQM7_9BILA
MKGENEEKMKMSCRRELNLTPRSLLFIVFAVSLALLCAILLTYFFTKNTFETSRIRVKRDVDPGLEKDLVDVIDKEPSVPAEKLRLPKDLQPESYDLNMKVYLPGYGAEIAAEKNLTFEATLVTRISVLLPAPRIVLNIKKLNITDVFVTMNNAPINVVSTKVDDELEMVTIQLGKVLEIGSNVVLTLIYTGPIDNSLGGLYQSRYKHTDGVEKIIATTQMEPTDARRMVPCFDEPAFKANWTVTIVHPKGTSALANSLEETIINLDDQWIESKFKSTPKMSSYLLAAIISEFEYNEGQTKSGTRFRVWSRPEAKDETKYALEAGIKCIEHYEEFYGIPFPLEKQDMVALPDFAAGAMENWGLITYRENSLLYDASLYKPEQKQRVAVVVAHELAHQWFGNLVTMKWWSDLWLNEGFAAFVEYLGTDFISDGKFRMNETFLMDGQESAFREDALPTSHPLSFKIDRASEVEEAFDGITYEKGSSVISMIRNTLGASVFDSAIKSYLKKFSYDNAEASDLFEALNDFVTPKTIGPDGKRLNVKNLAKQWTEQMGYPVLTMKRENDRMVRIDQSRFKLSNALDQEKYSKPEFGFQWDVPVWYSRGGDDENQIHFAWLPRDSNLILGAPKNVVPILNYESRGFYRVNYDGELWNDIITQLVQNPMVYSTKSRTRLISDAFAAAEAGMIDYRVPFNLTNYLQKETEFLPWDMGIDSIKKIANYYGSEPEIKYLRIFLRNLLKTQYEKSSIEHVSATYLNDDRFFENQLESRVIAFTCAARDPECLEKFVSHFKKEFIEKCQDSQVMASKCSKVSVPLRSAIYCEGVSAGDRAVWSQVFDAYQRESNQVEKTSLLYALSCSRDVDILKELLSHALNWPLNVVRLQDVDSVFQYVSSNPTGREFIFEYLLDKWDDIYASLKTDPATIRRVLKYCASPIRNQRQIKQLETFQRSLKTDIGKHSFDESIAIGKQKVAWIAKNYDSLTNFFKEQTVNL